MDIKLVWYEPIELGSSSRLKETIKNFDLNQIPTITGVYLFYRETKSPEYPQEVLYIGKTTNMRIRIKQHFNNLKLIDGLIETPTGKKCLIFAELKTLANDTGQALSQAERGLIQLFSNNEHPLLNQKLMRDRFDYIYSNGFIPEILGNEEIKVFAR